MNEYVTRLKEIQQRMSAPQYAPCLTHNKQNQDLKQWLITTTAFLNEKSRLTERMYCVLNDITELPLCKFCGKPTKFRDYMFGYNTYCGPKCSTNDPESKEKKKATNRERYGSDYFLGTKECLEKTKKTVQKKYGVDHINQSKEVRDRTEATNIQKYGCKTPLQNSEVIDKIKQTNLERYGNTCAMNSEMILDKIEAKHGFRHSMQNPEFREYQKQRVREIYGVDNIGSVPQIRAKAEATNLSRYGDVNFKRAHFINMEYWNDIHYIQENFIIGKQIDYDKACAFFNASDSTIKCHFRDTLGFEITNKVSRDEIAIMEYIRSIDPEVVILQGNRKLLRYEELVDGKPVKRYREIDIYLPDYKLAIEFDGLYFHSIGKADQLPAIEMKRRRMNPQTKANLLFQKGIKFLSIWENEWHTPQKQIIWKSMIRSAMNKNRRIFARKCIVKEITPIEEIQFLIKNHIQGYAGGSSHRYGLFYNNILKAVMTFSRPRFENGIADFELLRFSTEVRHTIIGGASKLLSHFRKQVGNVSIVSYANKRWSAGNLYDKLGFALTRITNPSTQYFSGDDISRTPKLLKWNECRKHDLAQWLPGFNPNITAQQNLLDAGYRMVYDAGNNVYLLN